MRSRREAGGLKALEETETIILRGQEAVRELTGKIGPAHKADQEQGLIEVCKVNLRQG
jgi:hypothetical protein